MAFDSDDLIALADHCVGSLGPLVDRDWSIKAAGLDWTCREVLEHICTLKYAPTLALRAEVDTPFVFVVRENVPIDWLLVTARTAAVILAEVARSAPPETRAWHPAGAADPGGFIAMMGCEFVVHTYDIATALGANYRPDNYSTRALLDRLFPWWPRQADPWEALQWASGRIALPDHAALDDAWLWHCAPLDEWDGTVPKWDPQTRAKATH